jgi:hypothetical protein
MCAGGKAGQYWSRSGPTPTAPPGWGVGVCLACQPDEEVQRTFDEAELSAELGQCLRDLGRAEDAAQDAGRMTGAPLGDPGRHRQHRGGALQRLDLRFLV